MGLFEGVFFGGFECSCQRLEDGRRLDLLATTRHDVLAAADYARLGTVGIATCRDGVSWVNVERTAGRYDFTTPLSMMRAARACGVHVAGLDALRLAGSRRPVPGSFPTRFGAYAGRFAHVLREEGESTPTITPINEMSYLAWAGGDVRCLNPFEAARGVELKAQLVRASIEAIEAIRSVAPRARFLQPEPAIRIVPSEAQPKTWRRVESDNLLQYQAWDMLAGTVWPSLGGNGKYLDIVGVNFYPDNQFTHDGLTIALGDEQFTPLSRLLLDVWLRYRRPMIISETGSEGDERAPWLRYVVDESVSALDQGCDLHGVTLYPILNHHGWADDRHCKNGLAGFADARGERPVHTPLRDEIRRQTARLMRARATMLARCDTLDHDEREAACT